MTAPGRNGGTPDKYLVDRLLDDPYFSLPPPKSTGKEYFNFGYVGRRLPEGRDLTGEDLLASLTVASAEMVAMALRPFHLHELVVAGGGTRNPVLMGELARPSARRAYEEDRRPRRTRSSQGGARVRGDRFPDALRDPSHYPVLHRRGQAQRAGLGNAGRGATAATPGRTGGGCVTPTRLLVRAPMPT